MPKYQVRLQSPTSDQYREVTLTAEHEDAARDIALLRESEYVAYSLDADPYLSDVDRETIEGGLVLDDNGKVVTTAGRPRARLRGKLALHHQLQPYTIEDIRRVRLEQAHLDRLIGELANLQDDPEEWAAALDKLRAAGVPINAVTGLMYGVPVKNQYDGTAVVDWDTDTIKVALLTAYTVNQDTHDFFNDASTAEITGTGYTAGGATLGTKTATYDTASDQTRLDAADTTWTTSTLSATQAVVYKSTGTASTSPLIGELDFGGTVSTTAGTFQITWDATGIVVLDVT